MWRWRSGWVTETRWMRYGRLALAALTGAVLLVMAGCGWIFPAPEPDPDPVPDVVVFPDEQLEQAVRDNLEDHEGPITEQAMATLEALYASDRGIEDLTGLEYAVNVRVLRLAFNKIRDLSPLAGLLALEELILKANDIRDISALVENSDAGGLGEGDHVDLRDNEKLDTHAPSDAMRDISLLRVRGVDVIWHHRQ